MIQGEATEDEIDSLEEASALRDIAHMPARVKCAVLGLAHAERGPAGRGRAVVTLSYRQNLNEESKKRHLPHTRQMLLGNLFDLRSANWTVVVMVQSLPSMKRSSHESFLIMRYAAAKSSTTNTTKIHA